MRTALVTGANKGVGFATVRALSALGIKVWLGARSPERGQRAAEILQKEKLPVEYLALDVTDQASIDAAAKRIEVEDRSLDILVNNAGIMTEVLGLDLDVVKPSEVSPSQLRSIYDTNFFGVVAVTQVMLPLLRRSAAGRIVNVASRLGSLGIMSNPGPQARTLFMLGYGTSKAALNFATLCFADELAGTPIKINSISPGTIATDLMGASAEDLARRYNFGTPADGAAMIVRYATLPDDGPSGHFFGPDGETPW